MINEEWFQYIEKMMPLGVTAEELAEHMGWSLGVVRNWLSRWATKGYLKHVPRKEHVRDSSRRQVGGKFTPGRSKGSGGRYIMGDKWWGGIKYDEGY